MRAALSLPRRWALRFDRARMGLAFILSCLGLASSLPPVSPALAGTAAGAGPALSVRRTEGGIELTVSWSGSVPAASFMRAGRLWLVFGAPVRDRPVIPPEVTAEIPTLGWQRHPRLTILQMISPSAASLERKDQAWVVQLGAAHRAKATLEAWPPPGGRLTIENAAAVDQVLDRLVGDRLGVLLVNDASRGMPRALTSPALEILSSLSGVVWRARADGIVAGIRDDVAWIGPAAHDPSLISEVGASAADDPPTAPPTRPRRDRDECRLRPARRRELQWWLLLLLPRATADPRHPQG